MQRLAKSILEDSYFARCVFLYLEHGDLGRVFFISSKCRAVLLNTVLRDRLLEKHVIVCDQHAVSYRFPWNSCAEAFCLQMYFVKQKWMKPRWFTRPEFSWPEWRSVYPWLLGLKHGQFILAERKLGMERFMLGRIYACDQNRFYELRAAIMENAERQCIVQWFTRYNQFMNRYCMNWSRVSKPKLIQCIHVAFEIHKERPLLVHLNGTLDAVFEHLRGSGRHLRQFFWILYNQYNVNDGYEYKLNARWLSCVDHHRMNSLISGSYPQC